MIYLNQAATTYPKPRCVLDAHTAALSALPEGQFRSSSKTPPESVFERCRKNLGVLFGVSEYKRIFFSSGATDSANAVIYGLDLSGKHVVTSCTEHNSILRPLLNLKEQVGSVTIVPCDSRGFVNPADIEEAIRQDTAAVFINHCSNVTGALQDLKTIGEITKRKQVLLIADVSQSAGCIPIDADGWGIDVLIFTGHKNLFGAQGTGGHYVRSGVPFTPYRYGGTGRNSRQLLYENGDYEYETGTQNGPGIAALNAGAEYVLSRTVEKIAEKGQRLTGRIYETLSKMRNVQVYGAADTNKGHAVSFNIRGFLPSDIAYILQSGYGIIVRTGFHCAPLIHDRLGCGQHGTVRVSVSDLTTDEEVTAFLQAADEIQESVT